MKKCISIFCVLIFALMSLTACGEVAADNAVKNASTGEVVTNESSSGFSVVTTIFPEYDWTKEILGENPAGADIELLLDNGVDLHNYQPTAEDILKIAESDIFIYVGGESDEWVEDALKEATNKDMIVINLLETLGDKVKEEEIVEGMEAEEHEHSEGEEEHEHSEDEEADEHEHTEGEEGPEYDEHVWLSLNNASVLVGAIKDAIISVDPDNSDVYTENANNYLEKLSALNEEYTKAVSDSAVKTVLFGDRFPFRYLTDDYGLDYYAAFVGCSAETEASFETIIFLAKKVDELSLHSILTIDGSDQKIANTIKDNTGSKDQEVLTIDSMQSTTADDIANGATYLSIMQKNLEVLKEALK